MAYRTTEKARRKKDAKRTTLMQTALQIFADKGYHAATVRDIVQEAGVAIGTFYFYFPDKETLFLYLYEETADFLLQTLQQAVAKRQTFPEQVALGLQAYVNIALYEPAVVHLLLVGGVGALPSLTQKHVAFREGLVSLWEGMLDTAVQQNRIASQNVRLTAEWLSGAHDTVLLHLLRDKNAEDVAMETLKEMTRLTLAAVGYRHTKSNE